MSLGKMPRFSAEGLQLLSGRELRPLPFLRKGRTPQDPAPK
jgi:hypothetical protein